MNFLNVIKNKKFLLEEENLYRINASFYFGHSKKIQVVFLRNLSKQDLDKINNAYFSRTIPASYLRANKADPSLSSEIDKNLYIIKYKIKADDTKYNAGILYFNNSEYLKAVKSFTQKNIPEKKYYEIEEASIDDIINIFLGKKISPDIESIKFISLENIDSIANRISISVGREKNKEKVLSVKPKEEEIETENQYTKEEREEAMKYLSSKSSQVDSSYSIDLYKIYDLIEEIKSSNATIKTATSKKEEKEEAKKTKKESIIELVSIIDNYDAEQRIKDTIFYVYIHSKFEKTPELQKQLEAVYKKEAPSSDNKSKSVTTKEKEKSNIEKEKKSNKPKQKKVKGNDDDEKSKYSVYSFDNSGKYIINTVTLTLDQLKKTEELIEKNKKKFLEDMEEYQKAIKEWDRYEKDMVVYKQLKKGTEPKEPTIPIPTAILPSKYGILKIEKKETSSKKVNELSATGGGAAPGTGASVTPGSGEGVATKYAFAKKPKIVRKKFEFKNEAKMIFWESVRGLLKNK